MKLFNKILPVILVSLMFFSCSRKIAYTSEIHSVHKFSEDKLKKVQFFTSEEIILVRTKQDGDVIIDNGKLVVRNNKDIEKIVIRKNTPCVLEQVIDNNKLLVSFEFGDEKVLLFGNNGEGGYSLMAKEWNSGVAVISYANKNYVTTNGNVYLLIGAKKLSKLKAKERTVKGRKV
jgi:hypothetical protein